MTTRRVVRWLGWGILVVTAWFLLAPTQVGGYDSYVVTDGVSMLPTIHGDGLVVTRRDSSYHVGEVVAYHNAQLDDAVILHRIVRIHDGHYTFKGDNNKYADFYPPTKSKIVGREWVYWPGGGRFLLNLETPWVGAIVFAILGMWAFSDLGSSGRKRRHRLRHRRAVST